jgi:hypothetical protein
MANELSIMISARGSKSYWEEQVGHSVQVTMTTGSSHKATASIGTSEEALSFGDLASGEGFMYLRNLDATNFITYGPVSGGSMVGIGKLLPGEENLLRLIPGTTVRAKADTDACLLQFCVFAS